MELLYLWVEEYKNIKRQGFNFSPRYRFDFDYEEDNDKNIKTGKIILKYGNIKEISNNFFNSNIINITGLIGKNGSGKSSVLNIIKGEYFTNAIRKSIAIVKEKDKIKVLIKNYAKKAEKLIEEIAFKIDLNEEVYVYFNSSQENNYFGFRKYKKKVVDNETINYSNWIKNEDFSMGEIFSSVNCIYYSSFISGSNKGTGNYVAEHWGGMLTFDISTDSLLNQSFYKIDGKYRKYTPQYNKYKFLEYKRQVDFVRKYHRKVKEKINLPKKIYIQILNPYAEGKILRDKYLDKTSWASSYYTDANVHLMLQLQIFWAIMLEKITIKELEINDIEEKLIKENIVKKNGKKLEIGDKDNLEVNIEKMYLNFFSEKLEKEKILFLLKFIKERTREKLVIREIEIEIEELELMNEFIEILDSICRAEDVLGFKWGNDFSSGEEMFLSLFSRVHSFKEEYDKSDIILLLDEPDNYLHPEWSRELVKELINYCELIFEEDKNIQVILSSHSPFFVSDLPRENIIFLDKDDNGYCKVRDNEEMKQTFGANIHTLFSDSFFMDSTIGAFAKSKIDWVLEILAKDLNEIRKNEKKIRGIIDIIGEPILKRSLLSRLNEKIKLDYLKTDKKFEQNKKIMKSMQGQLNKQEQMIKKLQSEISKLKSGDKE